MEGPAVNAAFSKRMLPGTESLQLIIQHTKPSLVEWIRSSQGSPMTEDSGITASSPRISLQSEQVRSYQKELSAARSELVQRLSELNAVRIQDSLDTVINAVIATVPVGQYDRIRGLPGVKRVYFSRLHRKLLDTSAVLQNAQSLWDRAGGQAQAGRGIKIGIIDTGIDTSHPMFTDNSLVPPAGFPKGESEFTNDKVIVARNYVQLLSRPQLVQTAQDESGHGTFVAGAAAGKQVTAPLATLSGMAPGAFLGNYKVFGTPGINDYTTTAAVLAAIEDAVTDGMNVLSLSLGSLDYIQPEDDPWIVALQNAISSGVVVVVSAGNDGPATYTISNPASTPDAITVGAVSNSRTFAAALRVTAPAPVPAIFSNIAYQPGDGPSALLASKFPSTVVTDVTNLDGNGLGCNGFPSGSLTRSIAFIQRSGCDFVQKVGSAAAAGAIAVIVYNHISNADAAGMGGLADTTIPAVMISNQAGLALKSFLVAHPGAVQIEIDNNRTITAAATVSGRISPFSAVGPAPNFSIKPDLVAIGENVYSAALRANSAADMYDPTGFTLSQGTSFSAPMVSGAAAAILQLFPGIGPAGVKSLLTTTANRAAILDGAAPASILQAGSGLLDMGKASAAKATFRPEKLNFGTQSYESALSLTRTVSITNISSVSDQYTLSVDPMVSGPTITLDQETTEPVSPGGTVHFNVTLQVAGSNSGGFQGDIVVRSLQGAVTYRIPYWAGLYMRDSSRILRVSQDTSAAGGFTSLEAALKAARPGNIIEIADSATYSLASPGLVLATNGEGLPLNDITLRAAAGQNPKIDGSKLTETPIITVVGLHNVLFQGLNISGGFTGISLLQPSLDYPLSVAIDRCTISNLAASSSGAGIEIEGGGTLEVIHSTISNNYGTGIIAHEGTFLTVHSSTIQNNTAEGIAAVYSNVQIMNSAVSSNIGPGLDCVYCAGTLDGNTFSANRGRYGDGVQISDGSFTITNNTFESNERAGIAFFSPTSGGTGPTVRLSANLSRLNRNYGVGASPAQELRMDGNKVLDNAGGVLLAGSTSALLVNNVVARSTDFSGGDGIAVASQSRARLVNNTIYKNAHCGIIAATGATVSVSNSILSANSSGDILGLGSDSIQFSLVSDRSLATGNNISGDPKFVNPDADIFDLSDGSPALDAGSNSAAETPFLDLNGKLRIAGGRGTVDMGAIEAGSAYPLLFPVLAAGSQPAWGDNLATGVALLNLGASSTTANLTAFAASGALLGGSANPATQQIGPASQLPILGSQLFGLDPEIPSLGTMLVTSLQKLAGFFLVFDADFSRYADGVNATSQTGTDLMFLRHPSDPLDKVVYALFNPGVNPAQVTATHLSASGTPVGASISSTLAPKGQWIFDFASAAASSGYVRVQSDRPVSGLQFFGNSEELSALGAVSAGTEARLYFPHIAVHQGFTTLIGIVNPNEFATSLLLTAYRDNGERLGTPALLTIAARGQLLQDAAELFKIDPGSLVTGYVIALSDAAGVQGFSAFRYQDGMNRSAAAVPADSVPRQQLLFSHVAHQVPAGQGGTYQTGVALLNPSGTTVGFTLRVFDGAGVLVAEKTDSLGPRQKVSKLLSHPQAGAGFFTQPLSLGSGHIEVSSEYGLLGFELFFTEDLSQLAGVPAQTR